MLKAANGYRKKKKMKQSSINGNGHNKLGNIEDLQNLKIPTFSLLFLLNKEWGRHQGVAGHPD